MNVMEEIKTSSKAPKSPSQTMGLESPELLKELKQPHTLKPVHTHTGLTTVFCGRGRINSAPGSGSQTPPSSACTNQHAVKQQRLFSDSQS